MSKLITYDAFKDFAKGLSKIECGVATVSNNNVEVPIKYVPCMITIFGGSSTDAKTGTIYVYATGEDLYIKVVLGVNSDFQIEYKGAKLKIDSDDDAVYSIYYPEKTTPAKNFDEYTTKITNSDGSSKEDNYEVPISEVFNYDEDKMDDFSEKASVTNDILTIPQDIANECRIECDKEITNTDDGIEIESGWTKLNIIPFMHKTQTLSK